MFQSNRHIQKAAEPDNKNRVHSVGVSVDRRRNKEEVGYKVGGQEYCNSTE